MAKKDRNHYQIMCKDCTHSCDLNRLLPVDDFLYDQLHTFLMAHIKHRLIFTRNDNTIAENLNKYAMLIKPDEWGPQELPFYSLVCRECSTSSQLGEFSPENRGLYHALRFFLHKHRGHEFMLGRWTFSPAIDPAKHLDRSTPQKEEAWLKATKILIEAILRIYGPEHESDQSGEE